MRSNRLSAITGFAAILLCLIGYLPLTSCKRTGKETGTRAQNRPAPLPSSASQRPRMYPYSVVPGGIHTAKEFATKPDSLAREHYRGLRAVEVVQNPHGGLWYVSFRIGNSIYWTRKRLRIPQGEALLKLSGQPDILWARTRCGNLLSRVPQKPILPANREKILENELNVPLIDEHLDAPLNASLVPFEKPLNSFPEIGVTGVQPLFLNTTALNQMLLSAGAAFGSGSASGTPFASDDSRSGSSAIGGHSSRPSNRLPGTVAVTPEPSSRSLILCAAALIACLAGARCRRLRLKG